MTKTATITYSEDSYDCEDCGLSYANGCTLETSDGITLCATACAACYGGSDTTVEDVLRQLLEHLGYEVKIEEEEYND